MVLKTALLLYVTTTELQWDAWMDKPRFHWLNNVNTTQRNLPHTAKPASPVCDHQGLFPKGPCPKRTELVTSLLDARALFWCGRQLVLMCPRLFPEPRGKTNSYSFQFSPSSSPSISTSSSFPTLSNTFFQTLSNTFKHFWSSLLFPWQCVMFLVDGVEEQSLRKEDWPDPWTANVPNSPEGHNSCTKMTSVSATCLLSPSDS